MALSDDIEYIKHKISNKSLFIKRVPLNTYNEFKQLADNDNFCNDFGMALKYLIDFHKGLLTYPHEKVLIKLEELEHRVHGLETKPTEDKTKVKKRLNGRVIENG